MKKILLKKKFVCLKFFLKGTHVKQLARTEKTSSTNQFHRLKYLKETADLFISRAEN